jgi:hypothetical protein
MSINLTIAPVTDNDIASETELFDYNEEYLDQGDVPNGNRDALLGNRWK